MTVAKCTEHDDVYVDPQGKRKCRPCRNRARNRYGRTAKGRAAASRFNRSSKGHARQRRYDATAAAWVRQRKYQLKGQRDRIQAELDRLTTEEVACRRQLASQTRMR